MPRGSADPPKSAGEVNVYWRRRVIALAAGIGLLGLVTWTVNGVLGGGTMQASDLSQTSRQHGSHHSAQPAPGTTSSPTPASTADQAERHPVRHGKAWAQPVVIRQARRFCGTGAPRASAAARRTGPGPARTPHSC